MGQERMQTLVDRLLKRNDANSVVEYAVFLALIAGVLLFSVNLLGFTAGQVFQGTSELLQSEDVAEREVVQSANAEILKAQQAVQTMRWSAALLVLSTICLAGYAFYLMKRRVPLSETVEEEVEEKDEDAPGAIFGKRQQILRLLNSDLHALVESRLEVRHLMSLNVTTVQPEMSAEETRDVMRSKPFRHLLVEDRHGRLVGIISDRDLAKTHAKTAAQLMTPNPLTLEPHTLVSPAITLMVNRRISCLPIVSGGEVVGVLTTTDLMMALQCTLQTLRELVEEMGITEPEEDSQPFPALAISELSSEDNILIEQ